MSRSEHGTGGGERRADGGSGTMSKAKVRPGAGSDVLVDVLDQLAGSIEGERARVGDVIDAFDDRSAGALITVIGLIAAAPVIGAIPGMSVLTGGLILLIAGQAVAGVSPPWVPSALRNRTMDRATLDTGTEKARPYARWVDRFVQPRLGWLVAGWGQRRMLALAVCLLALAMFPLALVPWGVQAPATGIVLLGVALIGRDGAFALGGYALAALTAYVLVSAWDALGWLTGA